MNDKASQTQVPRRISMGARRKLSRPVTGTTEQVMKHHALWQSMLAEKNATILWWRGLLGIGG